MRTTQILNRPVAIPPRRLQPPHWPAALRIRRICSSRQRSPSNTIILKLRSHMPLQRGDMQGLRRI